MAASSWWSRWFWPTEIISRKNTFSSRFYCWSTWSRPTRCSSTPQTSSWRRWSGCLQVSSKILDLDKQCIVMQRRNIHIRVHDQEDGLPHLDHRLASLPRRVPAHLLRHPSSRMRTRRLPSIKEIIDFILFSVDLVHLRYHTDLRLPALVLHETHPEG